MIRVLLILLVAGSAFAQNITNLYSGQQLYSGLQLSSVPSTAPGGDTNTPPITANLLADWDANTAGTSNGELISSVADLSTNGYNLSSSDTNRPYWTNNASTINGKGFLVFGANDTMTASIPAKSQPLTFYLVMRPEGATTTMDTVNFFSQVTEPPYFDAYTYNNIWGFQAGSAKSLGSNPTAAWYIVTYVFNGTSSMGFRNNVQLNTTTDVGAGSMTGFRLAGGDTRNHPLRVTRVLVYTAAHSTNDITSNYNWLKTRYGL